MSKTQFSNFMFIFLIVTVSSNSNFNDQSAKLKLEEFRFRRSSLTNKLASIKESIFLQDKVIPIHILRRRFNRNSETPDVFVQKQVSTPSTSPNPSVSAVKSSPKTNTTKIQANVPITQTQPAIENIVKKKQHEKEHKLLNYCLLTIAFLIAMMSIIIVIRDRVREI